jgi:ABC-type multidrug transport system ATPase subunit
MIKLQNLTKSYGKKTVLNDIDLCIPDHKISFIMGENGAGKTTLLKCMLDLEEYAGTITYNGEDFHQIRKNVHVIYDDSPLYLNLNGYKNIELLLNRKVSKEQIKQVSLKYLGEDVLKSKVKGYSYGQRKKLSLAIADLTQPDYLFMDEVSNGLDFETMDMLKRTLKDWSKHMCIIATGHQFEFYASIIDELFIIKKASMSRMENFKEEGGDLGEIYQRYAK